MRRKLSTVVLMSLLSGLFSASTAASEEQALVIFIPFAPSATDVSKELDRMFHLEDQIAVAIEKAKAGEHDGNEVGGGEFTIYCYGPDADRLFKVVEPVLRGSVLSKGARVVVRYGKPGAKQVERRM